MGHLIDSEFRSNARLMYYFESVFWPGKAEEILQQYPIQMAIHRNVFHGNPRLWIDIRKVTERSLNGDVYLLYKDMDYWVAYGKGKEQLEMYGYVTYEYKYKVEHGYHILFFETIEDATIFRLRFSEYISEVFPIRPDEEGSVILNQFGHSMDLVTK